jgi:hypothetical protein
MYIAKWVSKITVIDPDTKGEVELEVYKHPNGGIFAIDSSFLEQCTDEDIYPLVADPFNRFLDKDDRVVMLSDV